MASGYFFNLDLYPYHKDKKKIQSEIVDCCLGVSQGFTLSSLYFSINFNDVLIHSCQVNPGGCFHENKIAAGCRRTVCHGGCDI